jgi:hypothetical protein
MNGRVVGSFLVVLAALSTQVAFAQAKKPPLAESLTGDAKLDYDAAKVLAAGSDWSGALAKFTRAYDASKDPRLLWNMASCQKSQKHYAKTLELLRRYLLDAGDAISNEERKEARDLVAVLEPLTLTLGVVANESDAQVLVDDEPVGKTPLTGVLIDLTARLVRVHKDEFDDVIQPIPDGSREVRISVRLVRAGSNTAASVPPAAHPIEPAARTEPVSHASSSHGAGPIPLWAWIAGGVVVAGGIATGAYFALRPSHDNGPVGTFGPGQAQAAIRF